MTTATRRSVAAVLVALLLASAMAVGPAAVGANNHDDVTCGYPMEYTDVTGTTVTLESEPERIVTLSPSAAQTLWRIDAREKVVGVSMHAGFLEGAGERTNVSADPLSTDLETVVALEPDLVIAPNVTSTAEVADLRDLGLDVVHFGAATSVDDVIDKTATIGRLVGACEGTSETIDQMETTLQTIADEVPPAAEQPTVYYTLGDGFTPGEGTFQSDAIERAGLRNLAVEAGIQGWNQLSEEIVVDRDPEWIAHTNRFQTPPVSEGVSAVTAMQEEQIITLDPNRISQPSPAIIDAVKAIHEAVYGELSTPTPTPPWTFTPTPTATSTDTAVATTTASDGADGIPGFGPLAAVTAVLLTLAFLARRRQS